MAREPDLSAVGPELERVARRLVLEALEEATDRARHILVERLTATLIEEGERSLTASGDARSSSSDEPAGCYLFAITQAGGAPLAPCPGIHGSGPVREVVVGSLAAVVCPILRGVFDGLEQEPIGPESRLADMARRHDDVVRATFERRPVLPLRFGTVLPSEQHVTGLLEEEQERLLAELRPLEGRAEWTCRLERSAAAPPPTRSSAGGAAYLTERERQLSAPEHEGRELAAATERVSQAVREHVEATYAHEASGDGIRVSYLVPIDAKEGFTQAVDAVAEDIPSFRIEMLGPHPPYHFADVRLGEDRT